MSGTVNQLRLVRVDGADHERREGTGTGAPGCLDAPPSVRSRLLHWLRVDAARLLWPSRCLACDGPGLDGIDLCPACLSSLRWNRDACLRCAMPLPAGTEGVARAGPGGAPVCGACLRRDAGLARRGKAAMLTDVRAACLYAAPVDRLLLRFKFHGDLAAGALLSQLMGEAFGGASRPDALLPVPLHIGRLRRRGYDQALELARPIARTLRLPMLSDALVRTRGAPPQSELGAVARRRNLRGAFAVPAGMHLPAHVVLVDDVMTTGATLEAAADALRQAGVARVDAWVCARTT